VVGIAWRNWGNLALIAIAVACSGTVEQRYDNDDKGPPPLASGGSDAIGTGGALGDAGVGSVGGTSSGGTNSGGTNFGGTGAGGNGTGGAGGFANGGLGGFGNAGFGGGGVGGTDGPDSCFGAGTLIATPSGHRPIEELELGDLVLAYDEPTGRVVPRPVTATFVHLDQRVGSLPMSDGRVLRVTANHPIYLPDEERYAVAGELAGDERLLALSGSAQTSSLIAGTFHASTVTATVYNITVAGEHNYFAEGVLVHNKTDGGCDPVSFSGVCSPSPRCLDPLRPTNEYVRLNQVVGVLDAGHEGGVPDSGPFPLPQWIDAGAARTAASAAICSGDSATPTVSYLAFDVVNTIGHAPWVSIYGNSSGAGCSGSQIGEVGFQNIFPPPPYTVTTQCVSIPQRFLAQVMVNPLNVGTEISNLRFVSGCQCPRMRLVRTVCGSPSGVSGACEPAESDW
jgi:hypothetical protein